MIEDAELLHRYAVHRAEEAFAELVRRHLPFVYGAALRQVGGDGALAQDVAQSVFADAARKAAELSRHRVLIGWLFTSTRYAAAKAVRSEQRRRVREQKALIMQQLHDDPAAPVDWAQLRPAIDEALDALPQCDREAVLLRFFESRPFVEIGARFAITDDAARLRVERALEKMRPMLERHGVKSTTAALTLALANQPVVALPMGLAAVVTSTALNGAATGSVTAAIAFMTTTKASVIGVAVVAGMTGLWWQHRDKTRLEREMMALREQEPELIQLRANRDRLAKARANDSVRLANLQAEVTALKSRTASPSASATRSTATKSPNLAPAGTASAEGPGPVALATDLKPVTDAGNASSRAAVETFHWAINGGDVAVVAGMIIVPDDARPRLQEAFAKLAPEQRTRFGTPEQMLATLLSATTPVMGMQVMSDRPGTKVEGFEASLANDPSYRTVHIQRQYNDGRVREQDLVFHQVENGWRMVVPTQVVDKMLSMVGRQPTPIAPSGR